MEPGESAALRKFITQFIEVTDQEWEWHQRVLTKKNLAKGDNLLTAGQVCNHVSFVTRGCIRSYTLFGDQEITNFFFFENEYATDYCSFLTRQPANETLQATEPTEVLQLSYECMQELYEKIPAWQKFGRLIAEYVFIMVSDRARSLQYLEPEERYLKIMREMPHVLERVPQLYIASYIGVKPESLSRIRKRIATEKKS